MSESIVRWLAPGASGRPAGPSELESVKGSLEGLGDFSVYPRSVVAREGTLYFLARKGDEKLLGILSRGGGGTGASGGSGPSGGGAAGFEGSRSEATVGGEPASLWLCPFNRANTARLQEIFSFLKPRPLGLAKSAGFGDRLGLATPGHIQAMRAEPDAGMLPIYAQQSMRENARTGRHAREVMDDAVRGVFQEGWEEPWGADADHLKTLEDVDLCTACGYTFYTIDPGDRVDDRAASLEGSALDEALAALPWDVLQSSPGDLMTRLSEKAIDLDGETLTIPRHELAVAAVKYGRAVAHTVQMARRLKERLGDRPFDLEVSVDETEQVTSLVEHVYIAAELKRLGVEWVSMAPRYVGRFEKGVDYIGDLAEIEKDFARHLRVARTFGPYKLSLHSGSDKFSVYPVASRVAGDLVHLKTAGTSYLEALRAIAKADPGLFREIVHFALERYDTDRATYHVSADAAEVRAALAAGSGDLSGMLDDFHARQVLHVTFGSMLANQALRPRFFATLKANEALYDEVLVAHFRRHLAPFKRV